MEQWKEYKLGEVCTELSDGLHKAPKFKMGGDYIFVNAKNIVGGFIVDNDPTKKSTHEEYLKYASPLNDTTILYSIDGTIGKVALYRGEKCILGKGACYMNPNPQVLDRMFLYYELQSPRFKLYIDKMSTGSTIKHISLKTMREYNFTFPSLETQRQISSILKSLDNKIEVNRRINDNLEKQAQALFKSWFVDFEPFKDGYFEESELGMIPKGWKAGSLEDITTQKSERVGDRDDVKVLSPVTTGQLMLSEEFFTKQVFSESIAKYKVVEIGDFAYNPARVNIGSLGRNNYGFDGCVSPVYVVFSCKDGYAHLFDLYRKTQKFKTEVNLRAIGGVRQSLNYKDFAFIQCIIPPLHVVEKFNAIYDHLLVMQKHTEEENDRLASLRDSLLPRLMSGELKVNEIENVI